MWAGADSGQGSMAYLRSSVSSVSIQALLVTLTTLLPVADCAPQYTYWNKTPTATLAVFAATFQQVCPALHAQLLQVATLRGVQCQIGIRNLTAQIFGMFGAQVHPAFIQGLMLHVWASPESAQADLINTMVYDYTQVQDSGLRDFRQGCSQRHAAWGSFSAAAAGLQQVELSPGYERLSPATNLDHFAAHWLYLWSCAVETLTRERFDETPEIALRHIDPAVFQGQGSNETFPSFVARLRLAYEATISELTMMCKPHRIPHEDSWCRWST